MSQNREWFILKIFPKFRNWSEAFQRVCDCEARYRKGLESISGKSEFYHLYYVNQKDYPEGPHFKFFVKNPDKGKFWEWKRQNENNEDIDRIEKCDDVDDDKMRQGVTARQIFESVQNVGKSDMSNLKSILMSDKRYIELDELTGRHYVRNMLKITQDQEGKNF